MSQETCDSLPPLEVLVDAKNLDERFALTYEPETYRRVIAGKDVIIHCHHYNSRMQRTVESSGRVDGAMLIRSSAETVFAEQVAAVLRDDDDEPTRRAAAEGLYRHLGFGVLDFSRLEQGVITSPSSHYVEGWLAGFGTREKPVCTFVEGFIQGAVYALTGKLVHAREQSCMAKGDSACVFHLDFDRDTPIELNRKQKFEFEQQRDLKFVHSNNIDEQKIIDALVEMPIHGNDDGLIPAFSVYLANTPADYYNLLSIRFIEAMQAARRGSAARRMLVSDGESCAMNTFRGIMNSAEWDALVAPMVQEQRDKMYALVAISNGLGWGNWHILEDRGRQGITYASLNGYEALGYREYRGQADQPQCLMLTGVAAGLMELVYGQGTVAERQGTYLSTEKSCICHDSATCQFEVEQA